MDCDPVHAAPAHVFTVDLSHGAVVTVTRTEVWTSLAVLAGAALVVLAGSGAAAWFTAHAFHVV